MTATYHYRRRTHNLGPFTLAQMQDLARRQAITRGTLVSPDGGATWLAGAELRELFESGVPAVEGWYYAASDGGQVGPVKQGELESLITSGALSAADPVWQESFGDEWRPISDVAALAGLLPRPEPPAVFGNEGEDAARVVAPPPASRRTGLNGFGLTGFICTLVGLVMLAIPCLVWVVFAENFFWIFNVVLPLTVLAVTGLIFSILGLRRPRRGLAVAGTVLGVIAVSLAVMSLVGWATLRQRRAWLKRPAIDACETEIALARKSLNEAFVVYRGLRPDPGEGEDEFRLRQRRVLTQVADRLRRLVAVHDDLIRTTALTSEFAAAFEEGLPALRLTVKELREAAAAAGLELAEVLPEVGDEGNRLKFLMDTLTLYENAQVTLGQVEGRMTRP